VLNLIHTGHVLGYGKSRVEISASPSFPGSFRTAIHIIYRTLDLATLSNALIYSLAAAGVVVGVAVGVQRYRQAGGRRGLLKGACVAMPLLAPVVVVATGAVIAFLTRIAHIPVHDYSETGSVNRTANEDHAAFGPVGAVLLLGMPILTAVSYRARKVDMRHLALGLALPVFLVLLVLQAKYNAFLTRFLLVPAVLTAPLFARFFRGRVASLTLAAVASLVVGLTLADNRMKPLHSLYGRPWQLTQAQAVELNWQPGAGRALDPYHKLVPAHACVGAVVGPDEPSYLLYGARFEHRVSYLPSIGAVAAANSKTLFYVVISGGVDRSTAGDFKQAGWTIKPLADYWLLAVSPAPGAATGACAA
jgi:hypothetical protein